MFQRNNPVAGRKIIERHEELGNHLKLLEKERGKEMNSEAQNKMNDFRNFRAGIDQDLAVIN